MQIPPIGQRLRSARQAAGISLRELARRASVSASLVSQIETGRLRPSVSTLYTLTGALGIPVADLLESGRSSGSDGEVSGDIYDASPGEYPVTTAGLAAMIAKNPVALHTNPGGTSQEDTPDRATTSADSREEITLDSGVVWQVLGQLPGQRVDFLRIVYAPGSASSTGELTVHPGTEYGYVLAGELVMQLGDEERTLIRGDSVCFHSSTPHRFRNNGDVPAIGLWVVIDDPRTN